jgi:poly-gamma-glutamate synthesis protein (capsule biosynthesis protein)
VRGVRVAFIAADQVRDESTLPVFSAGPNTPGVANAYRPALLRTVRAARAKADIVVVYLHWGTEYQTCPNSEQPGLADALVKAGAAAVVGTHAHVLQGAGWRKDGSYVAYGLSNYLWWMSFGNEQDDNGVLTLTFTRGKVTAAHFEAAHLDDTGVPVPATGAMKRRIDAEWERDRRCADLLAAPPR